MDKKDTDTPRLPEGPGPGDGRLTGPVGDEDHLEYFRRQAERITRGKYHEAAEVHEVSSWPGVSPGVARFAESFGLMAVKLEAREHALEATIEDLRRANEQLAESLKLRQEFTYIFLTTVGALGLYSLVNSLLVATVQLSSLVARVVEFGALLSIFGFIRTSRIPPGSLGLTTVRARQSIAESLVATAPIVALLFAAKAWMLSRGILWAGDSLFTWLALDWTYALYLVVAPLQEFVARGMMQTSVERVLTGRHSWFWAILIVALVFGVFHLQVSVPMALVSMAFSFFWGLLYNRHRTIIGVSISHFIIGNLAGILGLWDFLVRARL